MIHFQTTEASETVLTELMIPSYANFGGKEESLRRFAEGKTLKSLAKQKRQLLKEEFHAKNTAELVSYLEGERMVFEN